MIWYFIALILFLYYMGFEIKIFWMQEYVKTLKGERINSFEYLKRVMRYFYYKKVRKHFLYALTLCIKSVLSIRISVKIGV